MGWGKPFSKKGWATKLFKTAAPIAAAFIPGVGPLAAAAIGAGIGSLGGKSGGGGLSGALMGGLSGGLSGLAAPAIKAGFGAAGTAFNAGGGGLGGLLGAGKSLAGSALGKVAGAPLGSGLMGPTQGSGLAGLLTGGGTGLSSVAKLAGKGVSSGMLNPLTSLLSGGQQYMAQDKEKDQMMQGQANAMGALNPYIQSGNTANAALSGKLSSGELGGAFNPGDLTQDPGYKFRVQQGEQALGRKQAAAGNYFSGEAIKEAQEYGQGIADQTYNDAHNRWLQDQQNTYGMLNDQSKTGLASAGAAGDIYTNQGNIQAGATQGQANTISGTLAALLGGGRQQYYDKYGNPIYV